MPYYFIFIVVSIIRAFRSGIGIKPVDIVLVHAYIAFIGLIVFIIYVIYACITGIHVFTLFSGFFGIVFLLGDHYEADDTCNNIKCQSYVENGLISEGVNRSCCSVG